MSKSNKIEDIRLTPDYVEKKKINWFPGHMAKSIRKIKEKLAMADIIVEVRDARLPYHSGNPALSEIIGQKSKIILFNKVNLANNNAVLKAQEYFRQINQPVLFINAFEKASAKKILQEVKQVVFEKKKVSNPSLTLNQVKAKMMIVGLPNTGKSTLINLIAGRNATKVANKPGQTQTQQIIKVSDDIELIDTPGVMMPSISNNEHGLWLALIHAIPEDIVSVEDQAGYLINYFIKHPTKEFITRYKLTQPMEDIESIILQVAKIRGCIQAKGHIDYHRAHSLIVQDFREGLLGHLSFGDPT